MSASVSASDGWARFPLSFLLGSCAYYPVAPELSFDLGLNGQGELKSSRDELEEQNPVKF